MAERAGEGDTTLDTPSDLLTLDSVKEVAGWGGGHPVIGPLARTALFWQSEAERMSNVAREWREQAVALGWKP